MLLEEEAEIFVDYSLVSYIIRRKGNISIEYSKNDGQKILFPHVVFIGIMKKCRNNLKEEVLQLKRAENIVPKRINMGS